MCEFITFFDKKKEYRCLSNFWECKVSIFDEDEIRDYNSGELCFHGEKFIRLSKLCNDEERKRKLLDYGRRFLIGGDILNSKDAKSKGGKSKKGFKLDLDEMRKWYGISMNVQKEICKYKLENYEEVREWLKKSGKCMLIHPALRCSDDNMKDKIWEGRMILSDDGNFEIIGGNKLGEIWMSFRDGIMI